MGALFITDWGSVPAEEALYREACLCRAGTCGDAPRLYFWRARHPAIVMGRGRDAEKDIYVHTALGDGVPVLVRASGGGTVFLISGDEDGHVLCVGVLLPLPGSDITGNPIREVFRAGLAPLVEGLGAMGIRAEIKGASDVVVGGRKIAGAAQARKRRAVLVHACVLVRTPVEDINRYIRHPEDEPEYRAGRRHRDFLTDVCSLTGLSVGKAESELAARVSACFSESMVREGAAF